MLSGTGREKVDDSTIPPEGSGIKSKSLKNVNSTCTRTVFKIHS